MTLGGMARGLRVVASGLAPTDRVVIGGLANPFVRPGVTVVARQSEIHPAGSQFAGRGVSRPACRRKTTPSPATKRGKGWVWGSHPNR